MMQERITFCAIVVDDEIHLWPSQALETSLWRRWTLHHKISSLTPRLLHTPGNEDVHYHQSLACLQLFGNALGEGNICSLSIQDPSIGYLVLTFAKAFHNIVVRFSSLPREIKGQTLWLLLSLLQLYAITKQHWIIVPRLPIPRDYHVAFFYPHEHSDLWPP